MGTILTVGPAGPSQRARQMLLESEGLKVRHASSQEAPAVVCDAQFDLILLDSEVSEQTERELRTALRERIKVIRLSGFTHPKALLELVKGKVIRIDDRHP